MKARFNKGFRHRTVIVKDKIIYIIDESQRSFRFDLNRFETEKEKFIHAPGNNAELLELLEQVSKLDTDKNIMEDIETDYKKDGWVCG